MNVAIGTLISSLDKIIKNKNTQESRGKAISSEPAAIKENVFSSSIQVKYQVLQSKLSKLQNELTREQAKLGILEKESIKPSEFSTILFGESPLFTESIEELVQEKQMLVEKINANKNIIAEQIKSVEIESENIHSISFGVGSDNFAEKLELIKKSQPPVTKVSLKNVERLIKD